MHSFSTLLRGWRLVIAVLVCAALSSGLLYAWSNRQLAAGPAQAPADPVSTGEAASPARSGRLAKLFTLKDSSAAERSKTQIEAAGLAVDGPSFVSVVSTRHQPLIDLFRQAGIDLNARGAAGRTALLTAALDRNWPLFDRLLGDGADPNLADDGGVTPLMAAALADRTEALKSLRQHGAKAGVADREGHTAAHYAIGAKAVASLRELLDHAPAPDEGQTLLAASYGSGDWRLIAPVLSRAASGLAWEPASQHALGEALAARDAEKVRLLLSHYEGPPTPEGSSQPLLAHALVANDLAQFKLLLEAGADPNAALQSPVDKAFTKAIGAEAIRYYAAVEPGVNTLMLAAGLGRAEYVRLLLEKGAKRSVATDKLKMYPLYFAAEAQDAPTMQLLIGDCPTPEQMRIEISLGSQHATVIRDGQSILNTRISTGRPGFATPTGNFVVTDKHLTHKSTIYKAEMPFFMRLNCRDFGMHEGVVPDHPASHGCIRLPGEIARRLFKEIPVGTLVSIRQ